MNLLLVLFFDIAALIVCIKMIKSTFNKILNISIMGRFKQVITDVV